MGEVIHRDLSPAICPHGFPVSSCSLCDRRPIVAPALIILGVAALIIAAFQLAAWYA
jgi:hypothetical protein